MGDVAGMGGITATLAHRPDATGHDASGACANCGAVLAGPFCQQCGQHGHVHRTAGALLHDLAHGVFHFEGRFWATLPLLALRPGELTRRYVRGERTRFVSPMALFLFSVFLTFTVLANLPGASVVGAGAGAGAELDLDRLGSRLSQERAAAADRVAALGRDLARERARARPDAAGIARTRRDVAQARDELDRLTQTQRLLPAKDARPRHDGSVGDWIRGKAEHARENPQLLAYKLKSSAYKFSWALIPISLPFVWLLFPFRRDVGMYDHAVFATHSLSFMSLLVVGLSVLAALGTPDPLVPFAALLVPPAHIYRHLKGAYGLGRLGALWRTAWMLSFATLTLTAFSLMLLYMGTAH